MKYILVAVLCLLLLTGCGGKEIPEETYNTEAVTAPAELPETVPVTTETVSTLLNPAEPSDDTMVLVKDYIPEILVELKYSTRDNFTGQVIYDFQEVYLRYGTVKKLMRVQEELASLGLRLKIWDGFRPVSAQWALWDVCPDSNYVSHPETGNRTHCRGNAVDITLADAAGYSVEMPTGFDDFSKCADRDYSDCSQTAAENALCLQEIMEHNGFTGYFKEWWHFSDATEYPVEECFDPALISLWYADCNEYISLRTQPDTKADVILRIPKGEEMTLMGYDGDFAMVNYDGWQGFVLASYIAPMEDHEESQGHGSISLNRPIYRAVCDNYISLRTEASTSAEVITQIPNGDSFILLEWVDGFALVDYNGLYGYVAENYIEPA